MEGRNVIRLLLVEDSPSDADILGDLLEEMDGQEFDITVRGSLREARTVLREEGSFDVILLDLNLPDSNRLETLSGIPPSAHAPIIVQTGQEDMELALEAVSLGAQDYLFKNQLTSEVLARSIRYAMERYKLSCAAAKERERAEQYFDLGGMVMVVLDAMGNILDLNQKGYDLLGYEKGTLEGKNWFDIALDDEDRTRLQAIHRDAINGADRGQIVENEIVTKSGSRRLIAWVNARLQDGDGGYAVLSSGEDITDRREYERKRNQKDKMDSIGAMTSGIAHDFNNLLLPIITLTAMTLKESSEDSRAYIRLTKVLEAANHARDLIRRMMLFNREQEPDMSRHPLNDIVTETFEFLKDFMPSTITITHTCDAENDLVKVDREEIVAALLNLCSNARDAFLGKVGQINISARNKTVSPRFAAKNPGLHPGDYIILSVEDNGSGIDPGTQRHIFDPFFTTKEVGKGTGLGLASTHAIITRHGGVITVDSKLGEGARFDIYLPLAKEEDTANPP